MSKTLKVFVLISFFFLVGLSVAPWVIKKTAISFYERNVPKGQLAIENVDLNIFTGRARLKGVEAKKEGESVLFVGDVGLEMSLRQLLFKKIKVYSIELRDFNIKVKQSNNDWMVAGSSFRSNDAPKKQTEYKFKSIADLLSELGVESLALEELKLKNVGVHLVLNKLSSHAIIEDLALRGIDSTQDETSTLSSRLIIQSLNVDESGLTLKAEKPVNLAVNLDVSNLFSSPSVRFSSELSAQNIEANNATNHLGASLKRLLIEGRMEQLFSSPNIQASLNLRDLKWNAQSMKDEVDLKGSVDGVEIPKIELLYSKDENNIPLKGVPLKKIYLSGARADHVGLDFNSPNTHLGLILKKINASELDLFKQNKPLEITSDIALNDLQQITGENKSLTVNADELLHVDAKIENILLDPVAALNIKWGGIDVSAKGYEYLLAAVGQLRVDRLVWQNGKLSVAQVDLVKVALLDKKSPLFYVGKLILNGIGIDSNHVSLDKIDAYESKTQLTLTKNYKIRKLERLKDYFASKSVKSSKNPDPTSLSVALGQINLKKEHHIQVKDNAVDPSVIHKLTVQDSHVDSIVVGSNQPMKFELNAKLEEYGKITSNGRYTLFSNTPSGELKGHVRGVDLVKYNPYFAQFFGYNVKTGLLSINYDVGIDRAELDGQANVNVKALKFTQVDEQKANLVEENLTMPLDKTLDILRNKDGDVDFKLPIEGNINAPEFSLSGIFTVITKKALKIAAVRGVKQMFQPYATFITVGQWAGDKLMAIKLESVQFDFGETELTNLQKKYLDKVGGVLKGKKKISLKLCSVISRDEAEFFMLPAKDLLNTADSRSKSIKTYLIQHSEIAAERILSCKSTVSDDEKLIQSKVDLEI